MHFKLETALNILLCHHHPQRIDEMGIEDYEAMAGGSELLALISDGLQGNWLLIHGHKHCPRIMYAQSSTSQSAVIISAGSFSGPIHRTLASRVTNQVHLIELHLDRVDEWGCAAGIAYTWDWAYGIGWQKSESAKGLPHICGFGYRESPATLAKRMMERFSASPFFSAKEIYGSMPELQFLTPDDLRSVALVLEQRHKKRLEHHAGTIRQFGNLEDA